MQIYVNKQEKVAKEDDCLGILIRIPVGKAADFTLFLFANRKSKPSFVEMCCKRQRSNSSHI